MKDEGLLQIGDHVAALGTANCVVRIHMRNASFLQEGLKVLGDCGREAAMDHVPEECKG